MITTILAIAALSTAVFALILAYAAYRLAIYRTGSHATAAKFAELEAELTDQASAIDGVRLAMTKIRARLNAQTRQTGKTRSEAPEFDTSTAEGRDAERAALEKELALAGKLTPTVHSKGH